MAWQRKVRNTSLTDRARFVWLWMDGMSLHAIARSTGISVTTVHRWIRRWQREGNVNTRPRGYKFYTVQTDGHVASVLAESRSPMTLVQGQHLDGFCYIPHQDLLRTEYLRLLLKVYGLRSTTDYLGYLKANHNMILTTMYNGGETCGMSEPRYDDQREI